MRAILLYNRAMSASYYCGSFWKTAWWARVASSTKETDWSVLRVGSYVDAG